MTLSLFFNEIQVSGFVCIITDLMHRLSLVYCITTPLHVSGISATHHQEVECVYVAYDTCYTAEFTVSRSGPLTVHSAV
jgi:hypothetical protein